jgi:predicted esterase
VSARIGPHAAEPVLAAGAHLDDAKAAVIMVHGRGAGPKNILDLVPAFPVDGVAFLAPGAHGGTWYPQSFMAPIEQNEPGIGSGISVIHGLIDDVVERGVPEDHVVLLGFSQGACLSVTAAQRRPARYGAVIAYSGGLIGPPGTKWNESGNFGGTPVFFGCSDRDAHVPETRVRESAEVLRRMGADVTVRIYPGMGHLVNDDEIHFTLALLSALVRP